MQKLCQVVQIIHEELSDEAAMQFLLELEMGVSPRCVAQGLIDTIFFESGSALFPEAIVHICEYWFV